MSNEEKERLLQKKNLSFLLTDFRPNDMVTIYYHDFLEKTDNDWVHLYSIHCALIPIEKKELILKEKKWDLSFEQGKPDTITSYNEGKEIVNYYRFGVNSGIEPLVFTRRFEHYIRKDYQEISQEFILFHNLYYDKANNHYIKIDSNDEIIVEIKPKCIKIRAKELQQFLSIKDMYLSIQFDYFEYSNMEVDQSFIKENNDDISNGHYCFSLYMSSYKENYLPYKTVSRLLGKKLIAPYPKEKSGWYGLDDEEKKYVDFIVNTDEFGKDIEYTCNPVNLSDNNTEVPKYLTPIFFNKKVLDQYYNSPSQYKVSPSVLECNNWLLQIDNHHEKVVCVWLGDLGRDLPYKEQLHWRQHNIQPSGDMSETYQKQQLQSEFVESKRPEHVLLREYEDLQRVSRNKFNQFIILPLTADDLYHLKTIKNLVENEQKDFDQLVLSLTKIMIDSLNEKFLSQFFVSDPKIKGSISQLEYLFKTQKIINYDEHIKFLRNLQNLRSSSSGHRKGKNYIKIKRDLGIQDDDLLNCFNNILVKSISFLSFLKIQIENLEKKK